MGVADLAADFGDILVVSLDEVGVLLPVGGLAIPGVGHGDALPFLPVEGGGEGERHEGDAEGKEKDDAKEFAEEEFGAADRFGEDGVDGAVVEFLGDELRGGEEGDCLLYTSRCV